MWNIAGDQAVLESKIKLDAFRSNADSYDKIQQYYDVETDPELKDRLGQWKRFFKLNITKPEIITLKEEIMILEKKIAHNRVSRETWYTDYETGQFNKMSIGGMRSMMTTSSNEQERKTLFEWINKTAYADVDDLIELIKLRNRYTQALWYKHFYDYKARIEEDMDCEDIFRLFDELKEGSVTAYQYIRTLEKDFPGIRQPWNQWYMLAWDFVVDEDQYFDMWENLLVRWRTMMNLGADYQWAAIQLDLLERDGKRAGGFCHIASPVHRSGNQKVSAKLNFTCNSRLWVMGEGADMIRTLFHEWWHAAHFANMNMQDSILNTEYPPASIAWMETQSKFMESILDSIARKTKYLHNSQGDCYPFESFEKRTHKLWNLEPRYLQTIGAVVQFERILYTDPDLTSTKVINYATQISYEYFDYETPYLYVLLPGHIYGWDSSCNYHGYGLAQIAVYQLREYFMNEFGYIADNPRVWESLKRYRSLWSSTSFEENVQHITWKKISTAAYLKYINRSVQEVLDEARNDIAKLETIPANEKPINLNAHFKVVEWNKIVCDNSLSFEDMCKKFEQFFDSNSLIQN